MRIHLKLNPSKSIISFKHLPQLTGTFHKWLGENNSYHGQTALHSFSWLQGARKGNGGLYFPRGAHFFISSHEDALVKQLVNGIMDHPELFGGMSVTEMKFQPTPNFQDGQEYFIVASPVLVKVKADDHIKHCLYHEEEANVALTQSLQHKMKLADLDPGGVSVKFDPRYRSAHTKLVDYRGVKNRANVCPVIINGTAEQLAFAWNVGVGNSTGIGFGALN